MRRQATKVRHLKWVSFMPFLYALNSYVEATKLSPL